MLANFCKIFGEKILFAYIVNIFTVQKDIQSDTVPALILKETIDVLPNSLYLVTIEMLNMECKSQKKNLNGGAGKLKGSCMKPLVTD